MTEPVGPLRRTAAGAVAWTASSQGVRQIVQVAVTAVLARHLRPDDFGIIAMAAAALAMLAPLHEMGMGAALVQRRELRPGHVVAVLWAQVGVASAIALALALAAPWIAAFFRREELVPVIRILCWGLPAGAAASTPQALLVRDLRFRRVAVMETAVLAVAGTVAAGMAIAGWGVWSLVAQSLSATALTALVAFAVSTFRLRWLAIRPSVRDFRDLLGFGAPLTGYQILNFFARNIDDVLIGRFLGADALGYYSMAYRVMMYPLQKVSGIVGRVSFPIFSTIQEDVERMRRAYVKSVQYIALVTFPMMGILMLVAPHFTRVLFGPAWGPVAPLIAVLCVAGICGSIGTTVGSVFLARGRSDLMLKWEVAALACYLLAITIGLNWGVMGVAVGYTIMAVILWPISHAVANRLIDLGLGEFYRALLPPAALAASVAVAVAGLGWAWRPDGPGSRAAFLAACAVVAAGAYLAAFRLGRPAVLIEAVAVVRETLSGGRREAT